MCYQIFQEEKEAQLLRVPVEEEDAPEKEKVLFEQETEAIISNLLRTRKMYKKRNK